MAPMTRQMRKRELQNTTTEDTRPMKHRSKAAKAPPKASITVKKATPVRVKRVGQSVKSTFHKAVRKEIKSWAWDITAAITTFFEPELLETIVSFVPCGRRRGDALGFLQAISGICRAVPSSYLMTPLVEKYGPRNRVFWTRSLSLCFDFTPQDREMWSFADSNDLHEFNEACSLEIRPSDSSYPAKATAVKAARRRGYASLDNYQDDVVVEIGPPKHVLEDFHLWPHLGIYYRPWQYKFLTSASETGRWQIPDSIDPCELFVDIAILRGKFARLARHGVYPCLLRRMPKKVTPRGTDLLDVCGLGPYYWDPKARMVSLPWPGLPAESHKALMNGWFAKNLDQSEMWLPPEDDQHKADYFAVWTEQEKTMLQPLVRELLVDWRHVRIQNDQGPQFFVGKRRQSNRWMGFVAYPRHKSNAQTGLDEA